MEIDFPLVDHFHGVDVVVVAFRVVAVRIVVVYVVPSVLAEKKLSINIITLTLTLNQISKGSNIQIKKTKKFFGTCKS